jgi:hypothetical protein
MDTDVMKLVVTALVSCVFSIIIAVITTNHKLKQQVNIDKEKENERIRIKYLQPLLVASQDSLGSYLINADGTIKNYRGFIDAISSKEEAVWFNRLIDFYKDIDKKLEDHLENIESSLEALIEFLSDNLQVRRTEYKITGETMVQLAGKNVPPHVVDGLENIKNNVYGSEIEFFQALVLCIGQDDSDDYKPSIMRYAVKRDF